VRSSWNPVPSRTPSAGHLAGDTKLLSLHIVDRAITPEDEQVRSKQAPTFLHPPLYPCECRYLGDAVLFLPSVLGLHSQGCLCTGVVMSMAYEKNGLEGKKENLSQLIRKPAVRLVHHLAA
jgi:hypothetical protein